MRGKIAWVVTLILLVSTTGCVDARAQFSELTSKAEQSITEGDFALADAYLAEAEALFPESPVVSELEKRVVEGSLARDVESKLQVAVRGGDWAIAIKYLGNLPSTNARFSEISQELMSAFEDYLTELKVEDLSLEEAETVLEHNLTLLGYGLQTNPELIAVFASRALPLRIQTLQAVLAASGPEKGLDALRSTYELDFYDEKDLESVSSQITKAYESKVSKKVDSLLREKDLTGAKGVVDLALVDLPNSKVLTAEYKRIDKLIAAAAKAKKAAEEEARKRAIRAMYVNSDTFEGINWYYDRGTYSRYAGDKFLLYMGKREGSAPWLKLRFMMFDSNWHFFEWIQVNVDGTKYTFTPDYDDIKRDNGSGDIWEWYDHDPTSADFAMLEKIIKSKSTRIRYINDDNFYEERTVRASEKKALSNVLLAYEALGGTR